MKTPTLVGYMLVFLAIGVMTGVTLNSLSSEQCEPVGKGNSRASEQLLLPYFLTPELIRGEVP